MHELSLCQDLIDQLTRLANQNDAVAVARIEVQVGVLSGVEAELFETAFTLAKQGSVAETAELLTEVTGPRVACRSCGETSAVPPNKLVCPVCGSLGTDLVGGHELILARVELVRNE